MSWPSVFEFNVAHGGIESESTTDNLCKQADVDARDLFANQRTNSGVNVSFLSSLLLCRVEEALRQLNMNAKRLSKLDYGPLVPFAERNGSKARQTGMMKLKCSIALYGIGMLTFSFFSATAQEVSIPDPGLNAAVRDALQKPLGPLTQTDMLSLTLLSAGGRDIRSVEGLETARNLRILDLDSNSLTNFPIAGELTNLLVLDLFRNDLTSFVLINAMPGLSILDIGFKRWPSVLYPRD